MSGAETTATPLLSVHDNHVYAYAVDCVGCRLTLHTLYDRGEQTEFTDVVFHDLVAHHFEHGASCNILFDVTECDVDSLVTENAAVFERSWRWGWPTDDYGGDLVKLVDELRAKSTRAYLIEASLGLSGWVLAGRCERLSRTQRAP